ncbi:MAG: hypothetical protein CBD51_005375 [Flavobacteriales bacterium TMED191]|nr:MAG: hypothetical protein CBD51_005375 [Flavobacteriales bacterium TMED191]
MLYIISPLFLFGLFYYLYRLGYLYNVAIELYSGYKYFNNNVLIPVKQTYTNVRYYIFYKNKYIVIIDNKEYIVDNLDIFRTNIQGITPICEYAIILKPHLIKNQIFYQRITSKTTVNGILDNVYSTNVMKVNPFIYISIDIGGKEIEINDNLIYYYLDKNTILDRKFIIWFIQKFNNVIMKTTENYIINIIDSNSDMKAIEFTNDENKAIVIDNNSYIVKTI